MQHSKRRLDKYREAPMFGRLFLIFTVIPLVELYLLIRVGAIIGALNTILLIIGTGLLGAYLAKLEGLRTVRQIQLNLNQGIMPAEELLDGVIILAAGLMLVTPGILTDICGFLLLIPRTRFLFKRWLRRRFDRMVASGKVRVYSQGGPGPF